MTLLNGCLSVINENNSTKPFSASIEPSQLGALLKEKARIERLSSRLRNTHSNQLFLEPPTHELFEIFRDLEDDDDQDHAMEEAVPGKPDVVQLKGIGELDLILDSDVDTVATPPTLPDIILDLSAYQERRKQLPCLEDVLKEAMELAKVDQDQQTPVTVQPIVPSQSIQQPSPISAPVVEPTDPKVVNISPLEWYASHLVKPTLSTSKDTPIHAYQPGILPTFCTPSQIEEADRATDDSRAQAAMFFNTNFDRSLKILNFPTSMIDMDLKEQWLQSGKAFIIHHLLRSLASHDICIAIITKDMDDEAILYDLIRNDLKLVCVRINYVIEEWKGEYGILVNTKPPPNQALSTQQSFERSADLIICLDIRILHHRDVFQKLDSRTLSHRSNPPVVWMIALGSVEMNAYEILKSHDFSQDTFRSQPFKALFSKDNNWPTLDHIDFEAANTTVASNLASWLLQHLDEKTKEEEYQFRSIQKLPQSFELGYLTQEHTTTTPSLSMPPTESDPMVEDETEDMEISSDSDIADSTDDLTLQTYLSNDLLPLYELHLVEKKASKELPEKDRLISDHGKLVLNNLAEEYNKKIENMRHEYEKALESLHSEYQKKASMATADIKQ
ncbi:hypothetical protein BD560DRAFT_450591 [Blakeslea trispora]|nr:hypothetical protein BD560DRAFT_450591 [Blakeslea trispora]